MGIIMNQLEEFKKQLQIIIYDLKITNEDVLNVGILLIEECVKQNKTNVIISKTGDDEILFYRYRNNCYYNIIIDEDADISFLLIPKTAKTKTESYYFKDGLDYRAIIKKI